MTETKRRESNVHPGYDEISRAGDIAKGIAHIIPEKAKAESLRVTVLAYVEAFNGDQTEPIHLLGQLQPDAQQFVPLFTQYPVQDSKFSKLLKEGNWLQLALSIVLASYEKKSLDELRLRLDQPPSVQPFVQLARSRRSSSREQETNTSHVFRLAGDDYIVHALIMLPLATAPKITIAAVTQGLATLVNPGYETNACVPIRNLVHSTFPEFPGRDPDASWSEFYKQTMAYPTNAEFILPRRVALTGTGASHEDLPDHVWGPHALRLRDLSFQIERFWADWLRVPTSLAEILKWAAYGPHYFASYAGGAQTTIRNGAAFDTSKLAELVANAFSRGADEAKRQELNNYLNKFVQVMGMSVEEKLESKGETKLHANMVERPAIAAWSGLRSSPSARQMSLFVEAVARMEMLFRANEHAEYTVHALLETFAAQAFREALNDGDTRILPIQRLISPNHDVEYLRICRADFGAACAQDRQDQQFIVPMTRQLIQPAMAVAITDVETKMRIRPKIENKDTIQRERSKRTTEKNWLVRVPVGFAMRTIYQAATKEYSYTWFTSMAALAAPYVMGPQVMSQLYAVAVVPLVPVGIALWDRFSAHPGQGTALKLGNINNGGFTQSERMSFVESVLNSVPDGERGPLVPIEYESGRLFSSAPRERRALRTAQGVEALVREVDEKYGTDPSTKVDLAKFFDQLKQEEPTIRTIATKYGEPEVVYDNEAHPESKDSKFYVFYDSKSRSFHTHRWTEETKQAKRAELLTEAARHSLVDAVLQQTHRYFGSNAEREDAVHRMISGKEGITTALLLQDLLKQLGNAWHDIRILSSEEAKRMNFDDEKQAPVDVLYVEQTSSSVPRFKPCMSSTQIDLAEMARITMDVYSFERHERIVTQEQRDTAIQSGLAIYRPFDATASMMMPKDIGPALAEERISLLRTTHEPRTYKETGLRWCPRFSKGDLHWAARFVCLARYDPGVARHGWKINPQLGIPRVLFASVIHVAAEACAVKAEEKETVVGPYVDFVLVRESNGTDRALSVPELLQEIRINNLNLDGLIQSAEANDVSLVSRAKQIVLDLLSARRAQEMEVKRNRESDRTRLVVPVLRWVRARFQYTSGVFGSRLGVPNLINRWGGVAEWASVLLMAGSFTNKLYGHFYPSDIKTSPLIDNLDELQAIFAWSFVPILVDNAVGRLKDPLNTNRALRLVRRCLTLGAFDVYGSVSVVISAYSIQTLVNLMQPELSFDWLFGVAKTPLYAIAYQAIGGFWVASVHSETKRMRKFLALMQKSIVPAGIVYSIAVLGQHALL